jgi:hypothetical protein
MAGIPLTEKGSTKITLAWAGSDYMNRLYKEEFLVTGRGIVASRKFIGHEGSRSNTRVFVAKPPKFAAKQNAPDSV